MMSPLLWHNLGGHDGTYMLESKDVGYILSLSCLPPMESFNVLRITYRTGAKPLMLVWGQPLE